MNKQTSRTSKEIDSQSYPRCCSIAIGLPKLSFGAALENEDHGFTA